MITWDDYEKLIADAAADLCGPPFDELELMSGARKLLGERFPEADRVLRQRVRETTYTYRCYGGAWYTWPVHPAFSRGVDPWPARYIPRAALVMMHAGAMAEESVRDAAASGPPPQESDTVDWAALAGAANLSEVADDLARHYLSEAKGQGAPAEALTVEVA